MKVIGIRCFRCLQVLMCNRYMGFGSIRQNTPDWIQYYLIDSVSPGEHLLRVGTKPGTIHNYSNIT